VWARLTGYLAEKSPLLLNHLKFASSHAIFGPNALAIRFATAYSDAYEACATERNVERVQEVLRLLTGQSVLVRFERVAGPALPSAASPTPPSAAGRRKELMQLPLFKRAAEVLGAQLVADDPAFNPAARPATSPRSTDADGDTPISDSEEG
jgi:DNA polymerase-3 subunit gamma/tau